MELLKVATDFDDVCVDTQGLEAVAARYFFKKEPHLLLYEEQRAITWWASATDYALNVQPLEGAVEYLHLLRQEGNKRQVVTSRDGTFLEKAREIATLHNFALPFHGVGHKKSKAPALRGWDVFIDNEPEKLVDLADIVPHRLLFSRPDNEKCLLPPGVVRVSSWKEIYAYIHQVQDVPHRRPCRKAAAAD